MIDLQKIETFLSATQTLSFSETAKQLHVSQPAVSHQIKALEEDLDATLFERTGSGLRLTEAGRLLLPWAKRLMRDSSDLQAIMSSRRDAAGELRIACSTTAGKYVLPQLAARFRSSFPAIQVRILACGPEDVSLNLLEGEAHVGVVSREVRDPSLEIQEFFRDRILLIAPPSHRWANDSSIEPAEILKEQVIMREPASGTRSVALAELAKHDIRPEDLNVFLEVGNAEAIVRTVGAGYGIGFVSELATDCALERGSVIEVRVEGLQLRRTIYMVRKRLSESYRPRDAFWSFVHAVENADLLRLPQGLP
ncbi:MAG: LysR substrate-binding domain-containing protein [Anaerolineales bacterium]|jgi:DNA-binding transcriptional LysR family regulator